MSLTCTIMCPDLMKNDRLVSINYSFKFEEKILSQRELKTMLMSFEDCPKTWFFPQNFEK